MMSLSAIDAAREYVEGAITRHVIAIAPSTLSQQLGSTDEVSLALLKQLRSEGFGTFRGYVKCPNCSQPLALTSTGLDELFREGNALVGKACRFCGHPLADKQEDVKVFLSFFLRPANGTDQQPPSVAPVSKAAESALSLSALQRASNIHIDKLFVVQDGGKVEMHSDEDHHLDKPGVKDQVSGNAAAKMELEVSGNSSSSERQSAAGDEVVKLHRRSGLLGHIVGHREEERVRKGTYSNYASHSSQRHWRIYLFVIVIIIALVGVVLLLQYFKAK